MLLNEGEIPGTVEQDLIKLCVFEYCPYRGGFTQPPGPGTLCALGNRHFVANLEFRSHVTLVRDTDVSVTSTALLFLSLYK